MTRLTSLLLLEGKLGPVLLHAIAKSHPELGLLLQRHALPSLLNVGQGRVGDGMARGGPAEDRGRGPGDGGAEESRGSWCAEHLV